jgi:hypothetical protein
LIWVSFRHLAKIRPNLETTGLFDGPSNSDPTIPPRSIAGDFKRDVSKIFKAYAENCK